MLHWVMRAHLLRQKVDGHYEISAWVCGVRGQFGLKLMRSRGTRKFDMQSRDDNGVDWMHVRTILVLVGFMNTI